MGGGERQDSHYGRCRCIVTRLRGPSRFDPISQQQEIAHRKLAQDELVAANETISGLLEDARIETSAITQISELASLLQACASRDEVLRVIPERLSRLFPGTSGALWMLNASKDRAESAAEWGMRPPLDQTFAPDECWSLRRGCTHTLSAGGSSLRCSHLQAEGSSACIPLIANGEALGVLSIQDDQRPDASSSPDSDAFTRRTQLASALAEHIALAVQTSTFVRHSACRPSAIR